MIGRDVTPRVAERWRHRFAEHIRHWTQRSFERRLQADWEDWRHSTEIKPRWFRRQSAALKTQNFRSLVQVNIYRSPPGTPPR